jgi:hypothetical protein
VWFGWPVRDLGRAGREAAVTKAQVQVIGVGEKGGGGVLVGPLQDRCGGHDGCTCRLAASSRMTCSG